MIIQDLDESGPLRRVVEWSDTDAAGIYYHGTVLRWAEAAEAAFLKARDMVLFIPTMPRVRFEVEYLHPLRFGDEVTITLAVEKLGRTSIHYSFAVERGDAVAARGKMVAVRIDPATEAGLAWTGAERAALEDAPVRATAV